MESRRFVALDRDGTLIVERNYLSDPQQVELIPGVVEGLQQLRLIGLGLVVITNQSGIGRGYFNQEQLDLIHRRMCELLQVHGIRIDGIYYCPHTPQDRCQCRKPASAMLELASHELRFDPRSSFMVGDKASDIELGHRTGATTFLVRTGYGAQVADEGVAKPDYTVDGLPEMAQIIQQIIGASEREKRSVADGSQR
jgi:D-glycero-D-manno-heptose 1,7-bisphosphate phosphatase